MTDVMSVRRKVNHASLR